MPVSGQHYEPDADLASLRDHPRNPRKGHDRAVSESIDRNGWYGAIIVQRRTGYILAGHTRRRALTAAGRDRGPVLWVDCDDDAALRILLADNRTAELAVWDEAELAALLREVSPDELSATGFEFEDMRDLERTLDASRSGQVDAEQEWENAGMPGYQNDNLNGAFQTTVHFATVDHAEAFFKMLDRPKARSLWWPETDGHKGMDVRSRVIAEAQ